MEFLEREIQQARVLVGLLEKAQYLVARLDARSESLLKPDLCKIMEDMREKVRTEARYG